LCGDDFNPKGTNQEAQVQFGQGMIPTLNPSDNVINLEDFSQSFGPSPSQHLVIINLDDSDFTTLIKGIKQPIVGAVPKNIKVKRKWSLVFKLVIDAIDKNNKVLTDAMYHINSV
jgi:hypothetical protein